jgi:hypothetical protein
VTLAAAVVVLSLFAYACGLLAIAPREQVGGVRYEVNHRQFLVLESIKELP